MFLPTTERRNPGLIAAARDLHGRGAIEPDTYVIDRDAVEANSRAIAETAARHHVEPWFVVKQIGRNPLLTRTIGRHIGRAAAIDAREARALLHAGARLGNIGHLVQPPRHQLGPLLAAGTGHVTVYDVANLRAVDRAARQVGTVQDVLLKIDGEPGDTYPGQEGGIAPAEVPAVLDSAGALPGVRVAGVTGFPCVLFDRGAGRPRHTATLARVLTAAETLRDNGITPVVSLPSHSSCSTIPGLAAAGATHVEPGHALTGTTPEHAVRDDLPERPAVVYVSEVVQEVPEPALLGGGFYARGHATGVLIGAGEQVRRGHLAPAPPGAIDYYRRFVLPDGARAARLGESAVMAFRTQIFVTRSRVAVVSGIGEGRPAVDGIFDSLGDPVPADAP